MYGNSGYNGYNVDYQGLQVVTRVVTSGYKWLQC